MAEFKAERRLFALLSMLPWRIWVAPTKRSRPSSANPEKIGIFIHSIAVKHKAAALGQIRIAVTDITGRVQVKEVLQKSEEKFRLMFNQMVSASVLFEVIFNKSNQFRDYCYIEVNPAFEHNTGKKRDQVRSQHEWIL